jgi:ferredoxin-NADP reductase
MEIILQRVRILNVQTLTHDTKSFIIEKPAGYFFTSGQSMFVAIDDSEWRDKHREFTIASNPADKNLELIIKIYREREGVTKAMDKLRVGDHLLISKPFGMLPYDATKKHVYIAAGSAITKFLSLLRSLDKKAISKIVFIYSNKTKGDVILEDELKKIFSGVMDNLVLVLTREGARGYHHGRIDHDLLEKFVSKETKVTATGPDEFVKEIMNISRSIQSE